MIRVGSLLGIAAIIVAPLIGSDAPTPDWELQTPTMTDGLPAAGHRVRITPPEYAGTDVHHSLYLPTD